MDEEKKEITENIAETEESDIPVVENKPDEKAIKREKKKQQRKEQKDKIEKKYPDKLSFLLGLVVLIFAIIGIVLTVWNSVRYVKSTTDTGSEFAQYNEYLTPIAAVDPDPFDDITAAKQEQLLSAAIWSLLSRESTPDTYSYSGGYMLIPAKDIESVYSSLFGPESSGSLKHMTVQGYNSVFEYDQAGGFYKIPVTTISPIYIPQVTDVAKSGTALVLTVNMLSAESWARDNEGNFVAPSPDKVLKITLRELKGSYYLGAIQTVSSTTPETVTFENPTISIPQEDNSSENQSETTTIKDPEKTTLGGRV
ncbi:MAG: hypothetical protein IKM66_07510 [Clostridia bacterium]|nr:hypothetical protein [Clostridia bacterium]